MQASSILANHWPAFVRPQPDELLSSWIVRTAHAHGIKVYTFGKLVWPDLPIWNRDIDRIATPIIWETMARKAGTSPERGYAATLNSLKSELTGTSQLSGPLSWIMPLGIYHRTHRNHGLAYCPGCLKNDGPIPYYRRSWRLAFWVVCPTCGIYLHESCPICRKPVNFFRIELGRKNADPDRSISTCSHCAYDLTKSSRIPVTPKTLRRYRSLYRISREGWNCQVHYPHLYFTVLRQLLRMLVSSNNRAKAIQKDMRLRLGHPTETDILNGSFEGLPIRQRTYLVDEAMWLLEDWPTRFIAIMRYHGVSSTTILRDMPDDVPYWFSSIINEHFYFTNANRRFMPTLAPQISQRADLLIAPIKGTVGRPRKYDSNLICPQCGSSWISRNGLRGSKQRLECQQCGKNLLANR